MQAVDIRVAVVGLQAAGMRVAVVGMQAAGVQAAADIPAAVWIAVREPPPVAAAPDPAAPIYRSVFHRTLCKTLLRRQF
jgi:cation diffusion facilitator CzcD-associated flavoprotein CzcO